jgi:hypothetical protein
VKTGLVDGLAAHRSFTTRMVSRYALVAPCE